MPQIIIFLVTFAAVSLIARSFSSLPIRWVGYAIAAFLAVLVSSYVTIGINLWEDFGELVIWKSPISNELTLGNLLLGLVVLLSLSSVRIVRQGNQAIVERLGLYKRPLNPGMNFVIPLVEQVIEVSTYQKKLSVPREEVISADNLTLSISVVIYWRIRDLQKAYYNLENIEDTLKNLALTSLRSEIGKMNFRSLLSSREQISEFLGKQIDETVAIWGIKVSRVEIQDVRLPTETQEALEREQLAESERQRMRIQVEGERQRAIIQADIIAETVKRLQDALPTASNTETILHYLIAQRYIDANFQLGASDNAKIVFMDPRLIDSVTDLLSSRPAPANKDLSDS